MSSPATSVTGLGACRRTIVACFVFRREISRKAVWDFFDSICQLRTFLEAAVAASGQEANRVFGRDQLFLRRVRWRRASYRAGRKDLYGQEEFRLGLQQRYK